MSHSHSHRSPEAGHTHDDHVGHHHSHSHSHAPADFSRAFLVGIVLNLGFVITEVIFGVIAHSMALVADAGHNFSDVIGLVLAWWATELGKKAATRRRTYGFKRASILAALANAAFLFVALGAIAWEAIQRFGRVEPVQTGIMVAVSLVGIVVNTATALMFLSGRKSDLNVRAAFLHMVGDAGITAGVVVAGLVIWKTGWQWLDPTVSLVIVAVIFWGSLGLARDSLNMALDSVPTHVDIHAIEEYLKSLPGVENVHDLHVWNMSTTETALTVHLRQVQVKVNDGFYGELAEYLHDEFGIDHPTVQIETGDGCVHCHFDLEPMQKH